MSEAPWVEIDNWQEMPQAGTIVEAKWPGWAGTEPGLPRPEVVAKVVVGDSDREFHNLKHLDGDPSKRRSGTVIVFGPSFWRPCS